jgi:nucleotide-binding universal stress UspA family protein
MSFQRVVACVDLGDATVQVVRLARRVSEGTLQIATVAPERIVFHTDKGMVTRDMPGFAALEEAEFDRQERAIGLLCQDGDEGLVPVGQPVAEILKLAAEADLLVLATHGRRGVDRALLGSVAEEVLRRSPIPVLIAR